jgi:hypothetical protein
MSEAKQKAREAKRLSEMWRKMHELEELYGGWETPLPDKPLKVQLKLSWLACRYIGVRRTIAFYFEERSRKRFIANLPLSAGKPLEWSASMKPIGDVSLVTIRVDNVQGVHERFETYHHIKPEQIGSTLQTERVLWMNLAALEFWGAYDLTPLRDWQEEWEERINNG